MPEIAIVIVQWIITMLICVFAGWFLMMISDIRDALWSIADSLDSETDDDPQDLEWYGNANGARDEKE